MKLYEALKLYETKSTSIDTADYVYDEIITVDIFENEIGEDNYETFCIELQKKVELQKFFDGAYANAIVDWTGFLMKNKKAFEKYVKENWIQEKQYVLSDIDDFYCEWLEQFQLLLSGNGTESIYKDMIDLLKTCE